VALVYSKAVTVLTMKYYNRLMWGDKAGLIGAIINKISNVFHMQSILCFISFYFSASQWKRHSARSTDSRRERCPVQCLVLLGLVTLMRRERTDKQELSQKVLIDGGALLLWDPAC
jgi:hypothetical protein